MRVLLVVAAVAGLAITQGSSEDLEPEGGLSRWVPDKRSMRSMDAFYQRNVHPYRGRYYKRSMWSMDNALVRNAHPYKRSMWSMDRSLVRNVHPYKRSMDDGKRELLEYLRSLYDNNLEKRNAPSLDDLLDYLSALEELKEEQAAVAPDYEDSDGNFKRGKRGEPFVPAMSAPSPPLSIFSSGADTKRLIPDEVEESTKTK